MSDIPSLHPFPMHPSVLLSLNPNSTLPPLLISYITTLIQALRELRLSPDFRALPIHYVNGDGDDKRQAGEDRRGVLEGPAGDIFVQGSRI